ncbi:conserved hypothetical protein [Theileria orientalis strain Shintoku]|uniref:Uncharacterized protein n=1 Tax=Theileria orientalis strain Shintoku TaxID=869250 RepID=J4C8F4_THEOR|nr:conserved hypothetical protein [Theileria orientalis strain Shintoku]BAM40693.1 conserved hypothetical protein [Theileria orientalis strain Shintoku]|eukprot:XP_009690994.1 conserved hypothetical protein [Theileria orientalis strain Shintoku]
MRINITQNTIIGLFRTIQVCDQIPLRKAAKSKAKPKVKQQEVVGVTRYYPYIPPNLVVDTVNTLKDRESLSEILDLIYSPLSPLDTEEDRKLYQKTYEAYRIYKNKLKEKLRERELYIQSQMHEAIENLPENLYDEAVKSESEPIPEELTFQKAYREQLINEHLSDYEIEKLDTFRMLMYLRYPHTEAKIKNPGLFWLEEKKMISRQKQASLISKKSKTKN